MGLFGKKKIEGKTAEEWFDLAYCEKNEEKQLKYYSKGLKLKPNNASAWHDKGFRLYLFGKHGEAIKCYDKALKLGHDSWHEKGEALAKLRRYEEAIECFNKSIKIYPRNFSALFDKATAFFILARYKEAVEWYDKALEVNPFFEKAKHNKKIAEEKLEEQKEKEHKEWKKEEREKEGKTAVERFGLKDTKALVIDPREAIKAIDAARVSLQKAKNLDLSATNAERLLNEAKTVFSNGYYTTAVELAEKCKCIVEDEIDKFKKTKAQQLLNSTYSKIKEAEKLGINVSRANNLHKKAISEFDNREYEKAIEYTKESRKNAEEEIVKYKHLKEQTKLKHLREEALSGINDAHSLLQKAKKIGINTKWDEEKLNNAKLKLDEKDFSNATKLANECKNSLNEKINEYKEAAKRSAKQSLDFAYSKIREAAKFGLTVPNAINLHEKALSEFDNREYEKAIGYAEKCKKAAEDELSRYNYAKEQIRTSKLRQDVVKSIKKLTPIPKAEKLIEKAESALKVGNYNSAVKFAKEAEGETLRVKKDYDAYKETADFIFSIESEITKTKNTGVKIPKSEELIELAKTELNKNNFERAKELAEKAKRIAYERKSGYELAFRSISEAERILKETKNKCVIISSDLLTKSKQAFDNGDYEESVRLSKELKNLVNNRETKYREARNWIKAAEFAIEKAKEFGCDASEAEELLNRTRTGFEEGNYAQVISDASKSEKVAKEIKEKSKPEIEVDLSEKTFQPNVWEEISLNIFNKGNAHAKDIEIGLSEEVKVKDLEIIRSLNAGEKRDLNVSFKPVEVGRVPLEISTHFKDFDEKEYEEKNRMRIHVGEIKREISIEKEIEIKRGYEIMQNNDLRFGIRIVNNTGYAIMDVETILDYPKALFSLKDNVVQGLGNIDPNGERTAKYILTPLGCIHNEKIGATVLYKEYTGKKQAVQMRPKEVHCVCPFLKEKVMREGEFAELANTCEYIQEGLSFSGITVKEISEFIKEACAHRLYVISEHEIDTTKIVNLAGESIGEKAYYLLTAVIQPYKNFTQVALRAYSDKPYGLHGFLNEIGNSIRHLVASVQSAKEIGIIESKQVINIIDSVVQRTSISGGGAGGTGTGATSVNIEGSVVQRSQIGLARKCSNCGKEVQADEKFCKECGARVE